NCVLLPCCACERTRIARAENVRAARVVHAVELATQILACHVLQALPTGQGKLPEWFLKPGGYRVLVAHVDVPSQTPAEPSRANLQSALRWWHLRTEAQQSPHRRLFFLPAGLPTVVSVQLDHFCAVNPAKL